MFHNLQKNQHFTYFSKFILNEFVSAKKEGFNPKTFLIGPLTYLLLGKETEKELIAMVSAAKELRKNYSIEENNLVEKITN